MVLKAPTFSWDTELLEHSAHILKEAALGANVCADGNTNGVPNVPTERVSNIRDVEEEMIAPYVQGRRNWTEVLRSVFREEYKNEVHNIDRMVLVGLARIRNGYVPRCVMDKYREQVADHERFRNK